MLCFHGYRCLAKRGAVHAARLVALRLRSGPSRGNRATGTISDPSKPPPSALRPSSGDRIRSLILRSPRERGRMKTGRAARDHPPPLAGEVAGGAAGWRRGDADARLVGGFPAASSFDFAQDEFISYGNFRSAHAASPKQRGEVPAFSRRCTSRRWAGCFRLRSVRLSSGPCQARLPHPGRPAPCWRSG